ncbi:MAG: hypothetical protein AAGA58_15040 [Verrucomicrobiota bacterium]
MSRKHLFTQFLWCGVATAAFFAGGHFLTESPTTKEGDSTSGSTVLRANPNHVDTVTIKGPGEMDGEGQAIDSLSPILALDAELMSSKLTEAFNLSDPVARKQAILNLIANLNLENVDAALSAFEQADNRREIDDEFRDFLFAWAKLDGAAAAAYSLDPESEFKSRYGIVNVASGWAVNDPVAAKAFVAEMESGDRKHWMHYGVFKTLLDTDLTAALAYSEENERSRARGNQMDRLARKLNESYGPDGLMRWVNNIDHEGDNDMESYKEYAMREAIGYVGREDPTRATDWILENLDQPYMDDDILRRAAYTIGDGDAQETMTWLSELPDNKHRGRAIHEAVENLADRDPNGVAEWLNQVGDDPAYDSTFSTFATRIVDDDPISAINWALAIRDEGRQAKTVEKVLSIWRKQDRNAAEAWLTQNGIGPIKS